TLPFKGESAISGTASMRASSQKGIQGPVQFLLHLGIGTVDQQRYDLLVVRIHIETGIGPHTVSHMPDKFPALTIAAHLEAQTIISGHPLDNLGSQQSFIGGFLQ